MYPRADHPDAADAKDGNVFGRLLGFARAVWVQRLGFDAGLRQEANAILRQLPDEGQAKVMSQFDASGTKDGAFWAHVVCGLAKVCVFRRPAIGRLVNCGWRCRQERRSTPPHRRLLASVGAH